MFTIEIGPWLGVFPAIAACIVVATLLGWLAFHFRIEGVYFALLTIAFAEVARIGFDHIAATGGAGGFFLPVRSEDQSQWWNLRGGPTFFYYLALLLAAAAFVLARSCGARVSATAGSPCAKIPKRHARSASMSIAPACRHCFSPPR